MYYLIMGKLWTSPNWRMNIYIYIFLKITSFTFILQVDTTDIYSLSLVWDMVVLEWVVYGAHVHVYYLNFERLLLLLVVETSIQWTHPIIG